MKSFARAIALTTVLAFTLALAADKAAVVDVAKDPSKFDGKIITVVGKVKKFKAKTSKAGNKYFTFDLEDKEKSLSVYGRGELEKEPKNGDKVEVTGKFVKEKDMKSFKVQNEIDVTKDAKDKDTEKNGVKILP